MPNKRKYLMQKAASLSALGAGALVLGAGKAEASIVYSGLLNLQVGFTATDLVQYTSPTFGSQGAQFWIKTNIRSHTANSSRRSVRAYGNNNLVLGGFSTRLQTFAANKSWKIAFPAQHGTHSADVGARLWIRYSGLGGRTQHFGNMNPFTDKYALFRFNPTTSATTWWYGWIELSYTVGGGIGPDPTQDPQVTIEGWAYDNTGARIHAGALPTPTSTPEPGTLSASGLAALALGAAGLRRWRKKRQAA